MALGLQMSVCLGFIPRRPPGGLPCGRLPLAGAAPLVGQSPALRPLRGAWRKTHPGRQAWVCRFYGGLYPLAILCKYICPYVKSDNVYTDTQRTYDDFLFAVHLPTIP